MQMRDPRRREQGFKFEVLVGVALRQWPQLQPSYSLWVGSWSSSHILQIMHPSSTRASIFQITSIQQEAVEWNPRMECSLENPQTQGVEGKIWRPLQFGILSRSFQNFSISHVRRECNKVAHEVARQVSIVRRRLGVWHHEIPTCVQELLEQDCNHLC